MKRDEVVFACTADELSCIVGNLFAVFDAPCDVLKGEVSKDEIAPGFKVWNAHAAHGNTYTLRMRYKKRVEKIIKEEIKL